MKKGEMGIRFYDDCGKRDYSVSSIKDGMYYLWQRRWDGRRLRYNSIEGIIEHYNEEKKIWDVETSYVYQVEIIR